MEEVQSKKASGTEEAQKKCQQVMDPTQKWGKQMDPKHQQTKAPAKKDLKISKYNKDPNPLLL